MEFLIFVILAIIVLGAFSAVMRAKSKTKPDRPPAIKPVDAEQFTAFEAVPSLWVNASEKAFFLVLLQHLPKGYYPQGKVRLEDIISTRKGLSYKDRQALRGRTKSRHVDFLIIDWEGRPRLAVELDGHSHRTRRGVENDAVKTALFHHAGIALRRVCVGEDFHHIAATIAAELNRS